MDAADQLSQAFASFAGGDSDEVSMDGRGWVKCLRDCKLLGKGVTTTDADLIFAKVKPRGGRRIDLEGFQRALALLAERKGVSEFSMVWQVAHSFGPDYSNNVTVGPSPDFGPERFYYDTSTYTGTWKNGGPTTSGSDVGFGGYSNISVLVNRSIIQDDPINRANQTAQVVGTGKPAWRPSRLNSRRSSTPGSIISSARRPSTCSTPTTGRLSRSGSMSSIAQAVGSLPVTPGPKGTQACRPRRASTSAVDMNGGSTNRSFGDMTNRSFGDVTSRSEVISDAGNGKFVPATEPGPLCTGRSDGTTSSLTSSKGGEMEEAPLSELSMLCSDDIPSSETRSDPRTGKIWTYSAYRSAHIAELDLLSIRHHWLTNCSLVAASAARTQEFVGSWLPPPCPALVEDARIATAEPEAEAEGTQDTPNKRLINDEILADASPKPSKFVNLPEEFITETKSQFEKFDIEDVENDIGQRSPSPSRSPMNRRILLPR